MEKIWEGGAALISAVRPFETDLLAEKVNLAALVMISVARSETGTAG